MFTEPEQEFTSLPPFTTFAVTKKLVLEEEHGFARLSIIPSKLVRFVVAVTACLFARFKFWLT